MDPLTEQFEDRLELVGVLAGGFLVVVALGTLLGQPWSTNPEPLAVVVKLVGILAATGLGAGLVWLSWTGRPEPETDEA